MENQQNPGRIPKTTYRRLCDLEDHLYFLTKDLKEMEKDESHYKRVATELRLLICKMNRNKPLLLNMIQEFNKVEDYYLTSTNESNGEITKTNILDYPNKKAGFYYKGRHYSNKDIIITIASQDGSGHEDKSMDEGIAVNETITLGGAKPNISFLHKIGTNVKNIGFDFLKKLESEGKYNFKRTVVKEEEK